MALATTYYTLVASLPHLVRYDRAQNLPISRERLYGRLSQLAGADRAEVDLAGALLEWARQPFEETGPRLQAAYRRFQAESQNATLRAFVEEVLTQRSLLAALRWRRQRKTQPATGVFMGVGTSVDQWRKHWEHPTFGSTQPWVATAQKALDQGDAAGLLRLVLEQNWQRAERLQAGRQFQLENVFAYLFKWHITNGWLAHNADQARKRFEEMVQEVIKAHEQIF
jgi:hypothetical protein